MEYFKDIYGVRADQETFIKREEEIIDRVAAGVMEALDIEMHGSLSDSRGGICWDIDWGFEEWDGEEELDDDDILEEHPSGLDVHLAPNHIIEPDGDDWREEDYQEFAWLLSIGSHHKERIEETRQAIAAAKDLDLTLIRSTYHPDLGGEGRRTVTFSLKPESVGE